MKLNEKQLLQIKSEKFDRTATFKRDAVDVEARTVEVAFSSEDPYQRWFGFEILGHGKNEVELDWLAGGSAPVLDQHNHGKQIGVIESARVDSDGVGRAVVRFSKSSYAEEFFQDVIDGIRQNISVGYRVHDMKLVEESDDVDTYRVTKWEPFEVSFVSVPADKTVGVGRSAEEFLKTPNSGEEMEPKKEKGSEVDVVKITADTRKAEVERIKEINAIGDAHNMGDKATEFIMNGKSVDDFRSYALGELGKKGIKPVETPSAAIGLNGKEVKQFSFLRAINALANPGSAKAQADAAFELEASEAVQGQLKCSAKGIMVPMEVLSEQRAGQVVGDAATGGNLVATNLMGGSFIDLLRNAMILAKMGITTLDGLVGDVAVPKLISGYSAYWVDENASPTESAAVFGQTPLKPKTVGARTELSRKFLLQSAIGPENFARMELALALALEIDRVIINGSGTGVEPRGILNTTGIGAVACGANGGALTWANAVKLWSEVATDNAAVGSTSYLTNSKVVGKLMTTEKATGTAQFVVKNFPNNDGFTDLAGARCGVTNQVPSGLTKGTASGVCSAAIFGNFADVVVGHWGTLDLTIDPYSKAETGGVRVIALQDIDVAVRRAESFAAAKDILTD